MNSMIVVVAKMRAMTWCGI